MRTEATDLVGSQPGESPKQRVDRELAELLAEIRVALPGVELLLGFLLVLPFTDRFGMLSALQRGVYVGTFLITALATALFIAPTARHRLGFRAIDKGRLLAATNRTILGALALLVVAISLTTFLAVSIVLEQVWAGALAAGIALWFGLWWFALPLRAVSRAAGSSAAGR